MLSHFSHQSQNRLADLVAEHLDHLHYLNDILCLNITDLNQVLTDHLLHKLLIPLYIYSLSSVRRQSETVESAAQNLAKVLNKNINICEYPSQQQYEFANGKVSCIVALFLLSQVFLIISHPPLVHVLAWIILKSDRSMLEKGVDKLLECYEAEVKRESAGDVAQCSDVMSNDGSCSSKENLVVESKNITDEEKEKLVTVPNDAWGVADKPFLETIFNALDCTENDYIALFALSLLYAMANNKGKLHVLGQLFI